MTVRDKHGVQLKIGDWVLYPWWSEACGDSLLFGQIRKISNYEPDTIFVHPNMRGVSTASRTEKLPDDAQEREQVIFLRKLEQ
jgi:hypothetical protein